jgi:hypothetical protein
MMAEARTKQMARNSTKKEKSVDAGIEVSRLLEQSGAVLVRRKKHLVYQLPNGQNFISPKTPGDHRNSQNQLRSLRRALALPNQNQQQPAQGEQDCDLRNSQAKENNEMPAIQTPAAPPQLGPPVAEPPKLCLKERIEAIIRDAETAQEKLLAAAQAHERRAQMLKAMLPFAEEPSAEEALRALLPAPPPPVAVLPPQPPQQIVERVQVTRELVFAATQTFGDSFTVNEVMDLMTGGKQIAGPERLRVRQSIAAAMITLHERGALMKTDEHSGRRQTTWKKAESNGHGQANGAHA